jgi:hypothetical protein
MAESEIVGRSCLRKVALERAGTVSHLVEHGDRIHSEANSASAVDVAAPIYLEKAARGGVVYSRQLVDDLWIRRQWHNSVVGIIETSVVGIIETFAIASRAQSKSVPEFWSDARGFVKGRSSRKVALEGALDVAIGHLIEHAVRVAAQARILVGAGCAARTNRDDAAVSSQIAERIQITIARCHKTDKERSDRDQAEHGVKIGLEFGFQNDL